MLLELPFWVENSQSNPTVCGGTPILDLIEDSDNLTAVIELPGMRKEDIALTLDHGVLTIAGERRLTVSEGQTMTRNERFQGAFLREVTLPMRVDSTKVTASYQDGVLTVSLPKADEAKPRQIKINAD